MAHFPLTRMRRLRYKAWVRSLVAEAHLSVQDLILPIFIQEGENVSSDIPTMPGVSRLSIDKAVKLCRYASQLGIPAIALFPSITQDLKDNEAKYAFRPDSLIFQAIRAIKEADINIGIICDVALDPYTLHGHDGIVVDEEVDNDQTIQALVRYSLLLAEAGADMVAPSDMMDGRIKAIRMALDENNYDKVLILSYAAKYKSSLYGPFRDGVGSSSNLAMQEKSSYQIQIANQKEALREVEMDIQEGADIIMIKPGIFYLDIIKSVAERHLTPLFVYQVSGEYAMLKFGAERGIFSYEKALYESLIAFKRAGANAIITYAAIEMAEILTHKG